MDLIFIGFALGGIVFFGKIILDYINEVPVWKEKIEQAELEQVQYEAEIQDVTSQTESVSHESKSLDDEINKMESMTAELKVEIGKIKKEMARKGKVIMRRQPDQESN